MTDNNFYITTTLPYVNADPHIGFAMEIIRADVIARYQRLLGKNVIFNTGTDEHGLKIYQKATELGVAPLEYCSKHAENYRGLKDALNLSFTNFIRTTDPHHIFASQEFWRRCNKNGDIYKAHYQTKYCVGCELEKTDSELTDGKCPIHPHLVIQIIDEENYFFRFSRYQKPLLELYRQNPDFVIPRFRLEEITKFVEAGLKDFSISRLKSKMPWGIEVPDDPEQVMYVWFDALVNYISTLGWPENEQAFTTYWPGIQFAGKDNLRQQSAMWQSMLLSAGLPPSKQIYVEGFITSGGQKMSKSLGNVIDPLLLVNEFGVDPVRHYLLTEIPSYDDGDFSRGRFIEVYNADLANGIGNLTARVASLCQKSGLTFLETPIVFTQFYPQHHEALRVYNFSQAYGILREDMRSLDHYIEQNKPWELIKNGSPETEVALQHCVDTIRKLATFLMPFLPQTAEKIQQQFAGPSISTQPPLFPRIEIV